MTIRAYWDLFVSYLQALKRIIYCALIASPVVLVTPAALYLDKEEDLFNLYLWCIETLGPTFIKMAQWASTRPDLFSPKFTEKLKRLQDKTTAYPWATAEKTLSEVYTFVILFLFNCFLIVLIHILGLW